MMKLKSLDIGRITLKNNVLIAPLAGFSDLAFREMCYDLGAGLCFTEMVSAKGINYDNCATTDLLKTSEKEYIKAVQLFGREPDELKKACSSVALDKFDVVDINMGCPVPKVFSNGEGSALLSDPDLCGKLVAACAETGKTVTVKMRLGIDKDDTSAITVAKRACEAGAKLITVHARRREDYYSGRPDTDAFKKVADEIKRFGVPIIYNGSLFSAADAEKFSAETGADGVMLARGALYTPWIIAELLGKSVDDKRAVIKSHVQREFELFGGYAAVKLRKQMSFYLRNSRGAKALRVRAFEATSVEELFAIIDEMTF